MYYGTAHPPTCRAHRSLPIGKAKAGWSPMKKNSVNVDAGDTYLIGREKRIPCRSFFDGYNGFNLTLTMNLVPVCDVS